MIKNVLTFARYSIIASIFTIAILSTHSISYADEFTSTSFRVMDPVIAPAGYSTSAGFQLWSNIGEIALGTSSAASFQLGPGFFRFPFASTPSVSTTAGDGQVDLSWTASQGVVGWTASGYNIGQSTVSGGPYSYTSLGNVTSSTRTGLTNSTTYYFVVIVKDIFGNAIATSTEVSATPSSSTPTPTPTPNGGGGSGGGGAYPASTGPVQVAFAGRAYPLSRVVVLKDGQVAVSTIAGPDSHFDVSMSGLSTGNYLFTLYGEDNQNIRSSLFSFPILITSGVATKIGGIFITPTIGVDKSEVKRGDPIAIFGQSSPQSEINISVHSKEELFLKTSSDKDGVYLYNLDTSLVEYGSHLTKSKSSISGEISPFGKAVSFTVGTRNVPVQLKIPTMRVEDLNRDRRINLVDFSILAYWYKRLNPPLTSDLNGDGKIDLIDFSIMAFYWTG